MIDADRWACFFMAFEKFPDWPAISGTEAFLMDTGICFIKRRLGPARHWFISITDLLLSLTFLSARKRRPRLLKNFSTGPKEEFEDITRD